MASIAKRGDGYRVRWLEPDGRPRSRQCPDKTTALRLKLDVERTVAEGRRWEPRDARPEPDIEELLTAYIRDRVRVLAPGTAERYARSLEIFIRWLRERYGNRERLSPRVLTQRLLRDFYEYLAGDGRHGRARVDSTRRKITEVVQLAWAWGHNDDEWSQSVPPAKTIEMKPRLQAITVAPIWAEMDAVISSFPEGSWHRQLATVLRFTGLRVHQAMMLLWSDVDLDHGTLHVRPEIGKSRQEKRGRIIPLSSHLVAELRTWGAKEGFLISTNRRGQRERQARPRDFERGWARAGVRKDVWEGRPHHSFRKGFVSGLRHLGADSDAVEFLVGHSLGLKGVYTDPRALPLQSAVALVPPLDVSTTKTVIRSRKVPNRKESE